MSDGLCISENRMWRRGCDIQKVDVDEAAAPHVMLSAPIEVIASDWPPRHSPPLLSNQATPAALAERDTFTFLRAWLILFSIERTEHMLVLPNCGLLIGV